VLARHTLHSGMQNVLPLEILNDAQFLLHNLAKLVHIHRERIGTTVAETKGLDNVTMPLFILLPQAFQPMTGSTL